MPRFSGAVCVKASADVGCNEVSRFSWLLGETEAAPMARTRYATDRGLIARMGATMFLLGLVFTAFILAIVLLLTQYTNVSNGGIIFFAVVVAVAISFGSFYWS